MSDHNQRDGGNRLRLDPTTPAVQAVIAEEVQRRVEALLPDLMAKLVAAQAAVGAPAGKEDSGFVGALALQLAELTGQGTGRIYVAPEIVETRRRGFERLKETLLETRAAGEMPAYRLINKVYLNVGGRMGEVLIDPLYRDSTNVVQSTEIDWPGVPNEHMVPINEAAQRVSACFHEWIGSAASTAPDALLALNSHGAVVRGDAARVILANDRARRADGAMAHGDAEAPVAGIRRDERPKQKVQVLGTLSQPVEVS